MQLSDSTFSEIAALSKQGDDLVKAGDPEAGKHKYIEALRLLPENHREWEAATWLYVAIGDVHFQMKNYDKAFKCFFNAVQCPKGLGNPYIHLRLGQLYYEQDNLEKAADELTRAYMGAGIEIFMEDDPKYLAFLETKIEI
ncbi:tetratricopeptide repeat protein [Brevibacillus fluminis]|uniref:Tetratricopeptide repeat protein n=1 Tax=Brevibacillus fluminis TaxID=511487 RepID=A0A3M8DXG3_9BACL|nr:tetratricopeptide repeat protein [Brevibacillus fluminis]RNB92828.1 tetratricopeptide repeat protein [Brevibacillus fluminis]